MIYAAIAVAALVVLVLLLATLAYRVLKVAHRRPGSGDQPHRYSAFETAVLSTLARLIRAAVRAGIRLGPVVMLTVAGRTTGEPRTNPVDLLEDDDGRRWLVATHTAEANWVRNLRAAGDGYLAHGKRRLDFTAIELPGDEAARVLREVMGPRLARPVGGFVLRQAMGLDADAASEDYAAAVADHPVFELSAIGTGVQDSRPWLRTGSGRLAAPRLLIGFGAVVAAAHGVLGATGVMSTGQWASGVLIGLLVAGFGNHLRIFGNRS